MESLKKVIKNSFRLSGFFVESNATTYFADILLNSVNNNEYENWINKLIDAVQTLKLQSNNIDKNVIEVALSKIQFNTNLETDEPIFSLINAFDIPKFEYNNQQKKFYLDTNSSKTFLPEAKFKSKYLLNRYTLLLQKTTRHELFSNSVEGISNNTKKFKLYNVENLLSQSKISEVVILGYLTQLTEGKFYIEDPTGSVQIDIKDAKFHSGFFCEGCFILAEGKYRDNILSVSSIGFPPPEPANSSRSSYGTQNTWGGKSEKLLKYSPKLIEIEKNNKEATLVFLSDVRLDQPMVLEKLKLLFIGYNECPPVCIVLMGPFFNQEKSFCQKKQLFDSLGDLVSSCEHLKNNTDIILVPAQEDPSSPNIIPRAPIPEVFVKGLQQKWKRLRLATNPCRLSYCSQQIVVCRLDLVTKLCRNTIHFPEGGELENHVTRTLICQSTLAPMNQIVLPVYWDYDAALQLYPLPDLVVIGDPSESFKTTQLGCTILNTGSFVKSKFSFKVYVPAAKIIEDSQICEDDEELL